MIGWRQVRPTGKRPHRKPPPPAKGQDLIIKKGGRHATGTA
nr:MAG TPA: hypothetical protein [Caudoviricetes sp.]